MLRNNLYSSPSIDVNSIWVPSSKYIEEFMKVKESEYDKIYLSDYNLDDLEKYQHTLKLYHNKRSKSKEQYIVY